MTTSTNTNHQFWHDGNSIAYYCDPNYAFSLSTAGSFAVTTYTATDDRACGPSARSSILPLTKNVAEGFGFNCAPNPAQNNIRVDFILPKNVNSCELIITDIVGNLVQTNTIYLNQSSLNINLSNVNNGMYFYQLIADGKRLAVRKVIVSK